MKLNLHVDELTNLSTNFAQTEIAPFWTMSNVHEHQEIYMYMKSLKGRVQNSNKFSDLHYVIVAFCPPIAMTYVWLMFGLLQPLTYCVIQETYYVIYGMQENSL